MGLPRRYANRVWNTPLERYMYVKQFEANTLYMLKIACQLQIALKHVDFSCTCRYLWNFLSARRGVGCYLLRPAAGRCGN